MISEIRYYEIEDGSFCCKAVVNNKIKNIFGIDRKNIDRIIKENKIIPESSSDNYVSYSLNSFSKLSMDDFDLIIKMCNKPNNYKKVNRNKSRSIQKRILGVEFATVIAIAGLIAATVTSKAEINYPNSNIETNGRIETVSTTTYNQFGQIIKVNGEDVDVEDPHIIDTVASTNDTITTENLSFVFSGKDRSDDLEMVNANNYQELFNKYGKMYGIDPIILQAMAANESSGRHSEDISNGGALGLMQIQVNIWKDAEVSAYNHETNTMDTMKIDVNRLKDVDYNIKTSAMILGEYLKSFDYNLPVALQGYNYGKTRMSNIINNCSQSTGLTTNEILQNVSDNEWTNYIDNTGYGNSYYLNAVLSFIEDGTNINIIDEEGNNHNVVIDNGNVSSYQTTVKS